MKDHTLMQTIARANRVYQDKTNGLIVDYIGVFQNLQKALSIYGSADGNDSEMPVAPKSEQVAELREAIAELTQFCKKCGLNLEKLQETQTVLERIDIWDKAVNSLLVNEQTKLTYFALSGSMFRLHKAILPDLSANEFSQVISLFRKLNQEIRSELPDVDITDIKPEIEALLDQSISAGEFYIPDTQGQYVDLSQMNFEALKAEFNKGYPNTQAEKLKGSITQKLQRMVAINKTRMDYHDKYRRMIEEYNSGSRNIVTFFEDLIAFAQELEIEDQRAIAENLTEEELTIFDLLTKPDFHLTKQEKKEVKQVAKNLLETLKREKLVLDWRKRQQARAAVRLTIEDTLDQLPPTYSAKAYEQKCEVVYQHIFEAYPGQDKSIIDSVA
jgi:type I restriction enzyme, R subunit